MGSHFMNSLLVMIVGMVVVLIGLIVLIALTVLMSRALKREQAERRAEHGPGVLPPEQIAAIAAMAAVAFDGGALSDCDPQLIAVITAALMASDAAEGGGRLVVRSVRRAPGGSAWASAGRQEQILF